MKIKELIQLLQPYVDQEINIGVIYQTENPYSSKPFHCHEEILTIRPSFKDEKCSILDGVNLVCESVEYK